ncbi:retinol dehydrogenase 12-like [Homarus americanus]|uniref:Retinol dehydrogenase 11-like 5 n=1 Tax=Homarus americanus TaxID=6706 RepID=A0A8J5JCZ5_HOMAM|nr:retinol dehydrogenase 12-like [Homarus americanus]XP_042205910.1 retinol dehydrogenase 12-like [Homarus americanus]XP_042205911.1 retinol dehydrogenase 12-like [Homarus americanus]XP_042205912.1 retinol dehydrogenase 12-like [Homarus americanus]XP_042205913.1 retinol dehydrogenase 12-like [Homarus americanus]KAG7155356.1 Retinol dehydrogenase 11-like 5 [Homarus americanus]
MAVWQILLTVVGILVGVIRFVYNFQAGRCKSQKKLEGKTVIVTGSSAGIGKSAAQDFARRGARVILACRNLEKAQRVADEIIKNSGNNHVVVRKLDTSDLSSVRQFANEIIKAEESLHILVNNAGIAGEPKRKFTADGLELTMATNYYGHFLLTNMLLKLLKKSAPSRIINVSSVMHNYCKKLDPEDLNFEKMSFGRIKVYSQSKLCNVLFTLELSEKLRGTGVTANSMNPGAVCTEIWTKDNSVIGYVQFVLFKLVGKDCDLGAQTIIYLAVSEDVDGVSGKYFEECKDSQCSKLGRHRGFAKKLWEASELDVKLQPEEVHY